MNDNVSPEGPSGADIEELWGGMHALAAVIAGLLQSSATDRGAIERALTKIAEVGLGEQLAPVGNLGARRAATFMRAAIGP